MQALSLTMVFVLAGFNLAVMAQRPSRGTIQQVRQRLNGLDTDFARFNGSLNVSMDNRSRSSRPEDVDRSIRGFQQATTQFRNRLDSNRADTGDVQNLLQRGAEIDRIIQTGQFPSNVQNNWVTVKADLDLLASNYNVNWNWVSQSNQYDNYNNGSNVNNNGGNIGYRNGGARNRLSGTYQLDRSRSDNVRTVVNRATRTIPYRDRSTVSQSLMTRLEPPDMISLDRQGRNVTLASSKGNRITFDADGIAHNEQVSSGRNIRMQANLTGDRLEISTVGNRDTDFTVTFEPIENGRSLRVTRRLYSDRITQPIMFTTIYTRTSDQPQWDIYTSTGNYIPSDRGRSGNYMIANGTSLTAILNTNLSTRNSREGDRFTMTVQNPSQYNGAVIEGYISNLSTSGTVTGRANMSLNFQQIRMPNGQTYQFDGFIDNIRTPDGETLQVSNEGTIRDADSQGTKTAERAGVGAAIGAVIGAIAGGGRGAGIGAVIGGGAGAGSVVVQGRDQLDLLSGSRVQLTASAPNR